MGTVYFEKTILTLQPWISRIVKQRIIKMLGPAKSKLIK